MNSVDGCSRQRKLGKWQMGMLASSVREDDRFLYLSLQGRDYKLSSWRLWFLFSRGGLTVYQQSDEDSGRGSSFLLIPLAFWPPLSKSWMDFASDLPSLRVLNVLWLSSQTPYSVLLPNWCSFALDPVAPLCPAPLGLFPLSPRFLVASDPAFDPLLFLKSLLCSFGAVSLAPLPGLILTT